MPRICAPQLACALLITAIALAACTPTDPNAPSRNASGPYVSGHAGGSAYSQ